MKHIYILLVYLTAGSFLFADHCHAQGKVKSALSDTSSGVTSGKEDVVKDFKSLRKEELLEKLNGPGDRNAARKAAKVLGDRAISGELVLTAGDKGIISQAVNESFILIKSQDANEREEAVARIHGLWHLAVPELLQMLDDTDPSKSELAAKSLILMRDEKIIKAIIEKAKSTTDDRKKNLYLFVLSKMQEQRKSFVPDRQCLDAEKSKKLHDELIVPALAEIKSTGSGTH